MFKFILAEDIYVTKTKVKLAPNNIVLYEYRFYLKHPYDTFQGLGSNKRLFQLSNKKWVIYNEKNMALYSNIYTLNEFIALNPEIVKLGLISKKERGEKVYSVNKLIEIENCINENENIAYLKKMDGVKVKEDEEETEGKVIIRSMYPEIDDK